MSALLTFSLTFTVIRDAGKLISDKCESTNTKCKKLENFRKKVCSGKMVKFYNDLGSLQVAVAVSLNRCFQDFPAVGWIRGDSVDTPDDIETKIEEYMSKHTVSKEDIEAFFEGETLVLNGGNASDLVQNSDNSSTKDETTRDTISLKGAKTLAEEFAKKLPKITMD